MTPALTLAEYAGHWLTHRRVRGRPLAPRTVSLYQTLLVTHLLPSLGAIPLAELTRADVRAWYDACRAPDGKTPMVTAKSYRLLRAICTSAVEEERMAASPCTLKGAGDEWSPERPILTVEQVLELADTVDPRWRALLLLGTFCGLRIGELSALRRRAIDLDRRTLSVVATGGNVRGFGWVESVPKSAAGKRLLTIPDAIFPDVVHHLATYAEPGPEGRVFVGARGGRLYSSAFADKVFRPLTQELGLTGVHFHDLRHAGNTLAASTGASLADLMARMGHASTEAALRYQHATRAQDTAMAEALSALVLRARRVT